MDNDFYYQFIKPGKSLADFVENIGMFHNQSHAAKEVVIMPDGRIDLFFLQTASAPFQVMLIGLETAPEQRNIPAQTLAFVISFKPLAVEYILHTSIADILNVAKTLPGDFWNFTADDLKDFEAFYKKASQKMKELLPAAIEEKKRKLFELIYSSNGEMKVEELSQKYFGAAGK